MSSPITPRSEGNIADCVQELDSSNQTASPPEETSKDDFSHSTFKPETSTESSSAESGSMLCIDNLSIEASGRMDAKTDKVCKNFAIPSHIEGRSEVKYAKAYPNETFLCSNATSHPNPSDRKVLSLFKFETTSFASPNTLHEEISLSSVQETSFSPIDSSPALNYSLEEFIRPCDSKTSPSI